jgi:hypothetical protein
MLSTTSSVALAIAIYLPIQHVLRHRRERQTARKYGHKSRKDLARMTMDEAGEIMRQLIELEMTDAFNISLGYGFLQVSTIRSSYLHGLPDQDQADRTITFPPWLV